MTGQRRVTSLQVRLEIEARSAEGQTDAQIAAALQWPVWTVRKWRRQVQRAGRLGLAPRPGRPATGVLSHVKPVIRETLRTLRETHPGGLQTLRLELSKALGCKVETLPSRARIAAWLHEAQLTRGYQRPTTLEEPSAPRRPTTPHEEWELDAQGVQPVQGVGAVTLINVADGYSCLKVESWGCIGCRKPATADYQLACRRAFLHYGRPQRISLDHDTVFYDSTCASPFPSRLHLWLLALGIEVVFYYSTPTDRPRHHRTHASTPYLTSVGRPNF